MKNLKTAFVLDKIKNVVESCKTITQLITAEKYCSLLVNKYHLHLFRNIGIKKTMEYDFNMTYKYLTDLLKNKLNSIKGR
jgi:hypothetical protein